MIDPNRQSALEDEHPVLQLIPPSKEVLQKHSYSVIISPGTSGHPDSHKRAPGAYYIANAFQELLDGNKIDCTPETVNTPHQSTGIRHKLGALLQNATGYFHTPKETGVYKADSFAAEMLADYEVTRNALQEGKRVIHATASHDAIGRALALKSVYPNAVILHWDKHPDFQKPGSGDIPGAKPNQVRGHAVWGTAVVGEGGEEVQDLCPDGAPRFDREDLFQLGVLHPDKSEAYAISGIDPETGEQTQKPIPGLTWKQIEGTAKGEKKRQSQQTEVEYTTDELRKWIDNRKAFYGTDIIEFGIEDDPDSVRIQDIGLANGMPTPDGLSSETKTRVHEWLAEQPDVKVVYYSSCEVEPDKDKNGTIRNAIVRWGTAAYGFADTNYFHGGYSPNERSNTGRMLDLKTSAGKTIAGTMAAVAASTLLLLAIRAKDKEQPLDLRQAPTVATASVDTAPQKQARADFLKIFHNSGFKEMAAQLRFTLALGDAAQADTILDNMASVYTAALKTAPDDGTRSDVGRVGLSEFVEGFGGAGDYYQRLQQKIRG